MLHQEITELSKLLEGYKKRVFVAEHQVDELSLQLDSDFQTRHEQVGHLLKQYGNAVSREKERVAEVQNLRKELNEVKAALGAAKKASSSGGFVGVEIEQKRATSKPPSLPRATTMTTTTKAKLTMNHRKLLSEKVRLTVTLADQREKNSELQEKLVETEKKYQEVLGQVSQVSPFSSSLLLDIPCCLVSFCLIRSLSAANLRRRKERSHSKGT